LLQTKLVPSREESNYHRCGRTDRGVSATGQVISLDLRTALLEGQGVFSQPGYTGEGRVGKEEEIDYCTVLNRCTVLCTMLKSGQTSSSVEPFLAPP
jgi:tRNA pseudouridine38/39 synthase